MNNCCMFQAHKDQPCRGISFSPTDVKFSSCSDDGTVRIWDFYTRTEERIMRGHGADVKQCDWHPTKGIVASGSKDLQSPIKLWDPKAGQSITTLYAHKGTVMDIQWARNGYWLASAARDHLVKVRLYNCSYYPIDNIYSDIRYKKFKNGISSSSRS